MTTVIPVAAALALAIPAEGPSPARRTPVVQVVQKAGPAIVNIGAEIVEMRTPFRRRGLFDDQWREFFSFPRRRKATRRESLGSGVIIDGAGMVLTNEHVVSRASSIHVTLADRRTFEADVVGADPEFDIAVLRIRNAKDLPTLQLGTSADLMPGEPAIAIGNPFGLSNSVSTGVVSALHRSIQAGDRVYEDFIQTDAAINPGNSGGALLNIEGKLIGINTAIHSGGTGIGFAIPVDKAKAIVDEVLQYGEVRPVYLGVDIDPGSQRGAVVRSVSAGSAAESAGLRKGDRIVDLGGQEVTDAAKFGKLVRALVPGQEIELTVQRRDKKARLRLTARELTREQASETGRRRLGLKVGLTRGRLVIRHVRRGSAAARVGIRRGDLLYSVAGRPLRSASEFDLMCAAIREAEAVAVIIGRGERRYYVTLQLG